MKESVSERAAKYIESTSSALERIRLKKLPAEVERSHVDHVLGLVRGYVKDASHYAENRKPVTSLACVAYAEGLLDAIKFLDLVDF